MKKVTRAQLIQAVKDTEISIAEIKELSHALTHCINAVELSLFELRPVPDQTPVIITSTIQFEKLCSEVNDTGASPSP